jgi:tetratricopeptide (TPR) repeat protein
MMGKKTQTDTGDESSSRETERLDGMISNAMRSLGWLLPRTEEEVRLAELEMQAAQEMHSAQAEDEWPDILLEPQDASPLSSHEEPSHYMLPVQLNGPEMSHISLAVLPFLTTSDDPGRAESSIFLDFADQLIRKLSDAGFNIIRPAWSSRMFTAPDDRAEAGPSLHVDYILDGRVVEKRASFDATISLVRVRDGESLLQTTYRANARDDVIHVEGSLAEQVALVFQPDLSREQRARLNRALTTNVDAYFEFKLGRDCFNQFNEAGLTNAVAHFERAFHLDAKFADAYACAAETLIWLAQLGIGYQHKTYAELFTLARSYADTALTLDQSIANAHASQGFINIFFEPDWTASAACFRRALALDPNCVAAHLGWSELLSAQGRFRKALAEIDLALAIDPNSLICNVVKGIIYYEARQWEQSLEQFASTLELHTQLVRRFYNSYESLPPDTIFYGQALCYVQLVMLEKAQRAATLATRCSHGHPLKLALRAYVYAIAGKRDKALAIIRELLKQDQQKYIPFHLALIYVALLEKNPEHAAKYKGRAFRYLRKAYETRDCWLFLSQVDPRLDTLRLDPRFATLGQ